jgi:hypothetical protein
LYIPPKEDEWQQGEDIATSWVANGESNQKKTSWVFISK